MPIIDDIFEALQNGEWHDLQEVSERTHLPKLEFRLLTNFLAEYNFIELDNKEERTRLTPPLLNFIKKIQCVEDKKTNSPFPFEH